MQRRYLILCLALGLAGCVSTPYPHRLPTAPELSAAETAALQDLMVWRAVGRLAVKSNGAGVNAGFDWQQSGRDSVLLVEGPFGAGRSRIWASPERIRIEAAGTTALEFAPPFVGIYDALVERVGFAVPLQSLGFWLRGVPDPNGELEDVSDLRFKQSGWEVTPDELLGQPGLPARLPRKVTLTQGEIRIRVVIDRWSGAAP